ncbi:ATP synthase F1 subunit gamma [Rhodocytophaga rosea]|uniref:ATP synthase gamma chain n=1 Tax=Rhodocytophaga rosea TaxID=2704465 RepID=A0A6C0GN51_9BACT|nr:ATP synthase F1 subunit gamma [Rhodocytophaga rosea]QHT69032.1 ATP synthase F1 subunit gamma [Rhodocytophaga rosea]
MPSLKEVRNRIQSVNSTQQITKAMKMVAAAKLRRAQDAITQMRPYAQHLQTMLNNISAQIDDDDINPFAREREANRVLIVVITSDRGLAGAFNANVTKAVVNLLNTQYSTQLAAGNVQFMTIGKRGNDYLTRRKYDVNSDHTTLFTSLNFNNAKKAAEFAMDGFLKGRYDKVILVYNEFKNVATQFIRTEQFLPLVETKDNTGKKKAMQTNYIFEPSEKEIFAELIPKSLKIQFYKAILESNASEHGARMTAMDKATDNAKELLKELKLVYNRTRQAAITKEILEIVGGAEALASS